MPHRRQEAQPICTHCDGRGTSECVRCGRPLCDEHAHDDDDRCAQCELEHSKRLDDELEVVPRYVRKRQITAVIAEVGLIAGVLAVRAFLDAGWLPEVPWVVLYAILIGVAAVGAVAVPLLLASASSSRARFERKTSDRLRREFMRQRPHKQLDPGDSSGDSESVDGGQNRRTSRPR